MSQPSVKDALKAESTVEGPYTFDLPPGTLLHLGGIPYKYLGDGKVAGGTSPDYVHDAGRIFPNIGIDPLPSDDEADHTGSRYANR